MLQVRSATERMALGNQALCILYFSAHKQNPCLKMFCIPNSLSDAEKQPQEMGLVPHAYNNNI